MRRLGIVGFVAVLALAMASRAHATPMLMLSDGVTSVTIADGGAGDSNPAAGVVTWIGAIGVWTINVTTGMTKPAGTATKTNVMMDLNSVDSSTGAGTLTIKFSDTGFGPTANYFFKDSIGGTTKGTISAAEYYDPNNTDFSGYDPLHPATNRIASLGPFNTLSFSGTTTSSVIAGAFPYSLTQVVKITHTGAGTTSFDYAKEIVPEPGSLLLLGSGLLGFGYLSRRRRKVV